MSLQGYFLLSLNAHGDFERLLRPGGKQSF